MEVEGRRCAKRTWQLNNNNKKKLLYFICSLCVLRKQQDRYSTGCGHHQHEPLPPLCKFCTFADVGTESQEMTEVVLVHLTCKWQKGLVQAYHPPFLICLTSLDVASEEGKEREKMIRNTASLLKPQGPWKRPDSIRIALSLFMSFSNYISAVVNQSCSRRWFPYNPKWSGNNYYIVNLISSHTGKIHWGKKKKFSFRSDFSSLITGFSATLAPHGRVARPGYDSSRCIVL